ncbi:MAG: hypothetical protein HYZ47_04315 [Simkania negevensis]|nr:hypothetical protein [Simkania negevensis]
MEEFITIGERWLISGRFEYEETACKEEKEAIRKKVAVYLASAPSQEFVALGLRQSPGVTNFWETALVLCKYFNFFQI